MSSGSNWKAFESTGSVQEYLHYKQVQKAEAGQQTNAAGEDHADRNAGPGASGS